MNIIKVDCLPLSIFVGYERENDARGVTFDYSAWAEKYGDGVLQLLVQRPGDADPYPVVLTAGENNTAVWLLSATDTAVKGWLEIQLIFTVGSVVAKTAVLPVLVDRSLAAGATPPDPYETWLETLTELAEQILHTTQPPEIRNGYWYIFDPDTGEYVNSGVKAEGEDGVGITGAQLNADYTLTLTFSDGTSYTTPSIRGAQGEQGDPGQPGTPGANGVTFTPSVDSNGNINWTNDGGLPNPPTVNIRGPQGLQGDPGNGDMIADDFSTSTDYAAGDYAIYSGHLYRFTAAHAAGAWTGTDAVQVHLAEDVADLKSAISDLTPIVNAVNKEVNPEPCIVNMYDWFWANGYQSLSSKVTGDTTIETQYLIVSGSEGDTTLTIDEDSPLAFADLYSYPMAGILENSDDTVSLVSLYIVDDDLTIYPPLKEDLSGAKIYSMAYGIHLSKAGYRYYTESFYSLNRKYSRKRKALAQYNPWESVFPDPMTKIGSFWSGKNSLNIVNGTFRSIVNCSIDYMNYNFGAGATAQSPKGIKWKENLGGKSGYFEMYIGARANDQKLTELPSGMEMTIEWYLDDVLVETYTKNLCRIEAVRFDFAGAQTGEMKLTVTSGEAYLSAFVSQITWWLTDETDGCMFEDYKVPCLLMDSWGVFHDNATAVELASLLTTESGMAGNVINNSSGSKTSAWGVENFYNLVWDEHPDYMITDFQINDINGSMTQATYIANMKNLINASVANGITPVILLSCHNNVNGNWSLYTFPMIKALTELPS